MPSVFVSIVLWNSPAAAQKCVEALLAQRGFSPETLKILITDNASSNGTLEQLRERFSGQVEFRQNPANLGFSAAHNQAAGRFLKSACDYFFVLNPDVRLEPAALKQMVEGIDKLPQAGSACPRLQRADSALNALEPELLDACGMFMTPALRHLDRGSGEPASARYDQSCFVFGGSGAALLLKRVLVEDLLLDGGVYEADKFKLYPALQSEAATRPQLFDEAFFAYREDADLAWRAQLLGWRCLYVAAARGYHERVVLPERRSTLSPWLNALSVRNRFLLQLNNFRGRDVIQAVLPGLVFRNLLVILGVLLRERTSLVALAEVFKCRKRALQRRKVLFEKSAGRLAAGPGIGRWFKNEPYTEDI